MLNHDTQTNENENHLIGNILAEDNSGTINSIPSLSYPSNLDSDNDDPKAGRISYGGGFGIGQNALYGGAFNTIPERVGSAPATDISVVIFYKKMFF
jgi:hypothetical protein